MPDDPPYADPPPPRRKRRLWPWLLALGVVILLAVRLVHTSPPPTPAPAPALPETRAPSASAPAPSSTPTPVPPLPAAPASADCAAGPADAAQANAASLTTLSFAPFRGRAETGWEIYALKIGVEIGSGCGPDTPAFAEALARWQGLHRLPASGVFDAATFKAMNNAWSLARPFVVASQHGACPPPPRPEQLVALLPAETYGKPERALPQALSAYRRMVADARASDLAIAADPKMLTVFSAFRDPGADAADCAARGGCGGPEKANCSAHRSGAAFDIVVGSAPGQRVDSSADSNRLAMSKTPAYRWLTLNAGRYGFLNYAFEPWHWEWAGETPP